MKTGETQVEKIIDIPLARIRGSQTSQRAKDVDSLAKSIAAVGLMMPVIVRPLPGKDSEFYYELVDGHRRLAAVKVNKAQTIRAIEVDPLTTDDQVGMLQLTANLQRLQLTPFEEAEAIAKLRKAGRTTEEIAADLGMRPQLIARRAKIIITKIKDMIGNGEIPAGIKGLSAENQIKMLAAIHESCNHKESWPDVAKFKSLKIESALEVLCEDILLNSTRLSANSFLEALAWIGFVRPFAETVLGLKWSDLEAEALKAIPDPKPKAGAKVAKRGKK